jgi:hypothetical protein
VSRRVLVVAIVAVLVVVTATVVIAVHQSGGGTTAIRPVDVTSADIPITVAHGGTVRLTGATLIIPPGAVSVDGRLVARTDGPQVDTSLGLNGKPGAAKPTISSAGRSVSFELRGGTLIHPATLTLSVDPAAFAQAGDIAKRSGAAWLAFYDVTAQRWSPVHSQYDPSAGAVTAQVPHLSTWNPFTWDWSALTLSLRQSLSAFGSGRAPKTDCPEVKGVTVTMTNDKDPPLIGCVTGDATSGYLVSITNNRAYSMVLTAPADAVQEPRDYAGFEEYVKSRDSVTAALGGPYLASGGTVTYRLPANGTTFPFTGAISFKTTVLDLAAALSAAGFDIGTGGYGRCVLDNVAHSGAATLSEAPKLVVECIPVVGLGMELLQDFVNLEQTVTNVWSEYDKVLDTAMKVHGEVDAVRPIPTPAVPSSLTATALSATSVRLMWQDKSSNESGFQIYVNNTSTPLVRPADTTSTDVTGLEPGTKYCFKLEALSSVGSSGKSAEACATTPSLPTPDLSTFTGIQLGKLYRHPNFPSMIGIDNHNYLDQLVWSEIGPSRAVGTGRLNYDNCIPNCAEGTYTTYPYGVTASNPMDCTVSVHADYSDISEPVQAYVYSVITVRSLSGTPSPHYVGSSVIGTGCAGSSYGNPGG